jgi:hypothetical protein
MKKLILNFSVLIIGLIVLCNSIAINTNASDLELEKANSNSSLVPDIKSLKYKGKKKLDVPLYIDNDYYNNYEVYEDANNTQYRFLTSSGEYCGMLNLKICDEDSKTGIAVTEEQAKDIANKYLYGVFGENSYVLEESYYQDYSDYYAIIYYNPLYGIKTDETVMIWVTKAGNVMEFNARNHGKYNKIKYSRIKNTFAVDSSQNDKKDSLIRERTHGNDYKIENEYISMSTTGKLVLYTFVTYPSPDKSAEFHAEIFLDLN